MLFDVFFDILLGVGELDVIEVIMVCLCFEMFWYFDVLFVFEV